MNTHSALSLFTSCASTLVFYSPFPNWAFQCLLFEWGALSLRDHRGGREAVIPPRRWSVKASIRGYHHGCPQGISFSLALFMGHSSWPAWPYFRLVLICKKKQKKHLVAIWWKTDLPLGLHTAPRSILMAHSCVYLPLNLRLQHKTGH